MGAMGLVCKVIHRQKTELVIVYAVICAGVKNRTGNIDWGDEN